MRYEVNKKKFKNHSEHEEGKNKLKTRKYNNDNNNIELRRKFFRQCIPPTKKGEKVLVTKSPKFSVDCYFFFEVSFSGTAEEEEEKERRRRHFFRFGFCVISISSSLWGKNEINIKKKLDCIRIQIGSLSLIYHTKKRNRAPISISYENYKSSLSCPAQFFKIII